ncbi:MAG: hypothetical protein HOP15_18790, partial [Planctomycetes bacterium]|nr:hypothetical protein [Planctomycetota bacterium]
MAATDPEMLRALARLARLALTGEEIERLAPELGQILSAFEVLGRHQPSATDPAEPVPLGRKVARTRG